jgi:aspartyl-tRNA(Asn)/glutamyl-tRNA(Gln) amidotransferase subunit A
MPPETTEALRARLALLGVAPSPDEPELERAFTLFAERMRLLDEAADLGPADPPYLAPPIPPGPPATAPPLAPEATGPPGGPPGLVEAAAMVRDGAATSVALVEQALAAVEAADGRLGAFVAVFGERALAEAAELDADLAAGRLRGPLHGVPVAVKDLIDVAGAVTGAGSPKLADNRATADAEVVARLRRAGAVVLGKTRTHEFAYGVLTPGTVNPWATDRIPGGSSGGSAVAVAAGMVPAAVGSDTAGSIRIPAACCGIVGFKPTYGAVPATGVWPLSWSCDHVGPLARGVADAWLAFGVLAGQTEPAAPAAMAPGTPGQAGPTTARSGVAGLRLGWLVGDLVDGVSDEVAAVMADLRAGLVEAGAVVDEVRLPLGVARAAAAAVVLPELAAAHDRLLTQSGEDGYGPPVLAALRLGPTVLASEYLAGLRYRGRFAAQVEAVLASRDALVLPTLPVTAPLIGQATVEIAGRPASVQAALTALPGPFNCSGSPVVSLPAGLAGGLPVGVSLVGRLGRDQELLEVAGSVEAAIPALPGAAATAWRELPPASA